MLHAQVEALLSQARQERARELSAYDLADEGGWIEGKRGGWYKMVNGRKVYKKGDGGAKSPPAAAQKSGRNAAQKPAPSSEVQRGTSASTRGRGKMKARRQADVRSAEDLVREMEDVQDSSLDPDQGFDAINKFVSGLKSVPVERLREFARAAGYRVAARESGSKIIKGIERRLHEFLGSSQRISTIDAVEDGGRPFRAEMKKLHQEAVEARRRRREKKGQEQPGGG